MAKFMKGVNLLRALNVPEERIESLEPFEMMMGFPPFGFSCTSCSENVPMHKAIIVEGGDVYCSSCFDTTGNEEVEMLDEIKEKISDEPQGCSGNCECCEEH